MSFSLIYGVVRANGGNEPREASAITYTISAMIPSVGPVELTNQVPGMPRRRETDVLPAPVGSPVLGIILDNKQLYWMFREIEAYSDCPSGAEGAGMNMLPDSIRELMTRRGGVTSQTAPAPDGPSEGGGSGGGGEA